LLGDKNNQKPSTVPRFVSMPDGFGILWTVTLEQGYLGVFDFFTSQ